MNDFKTIQAYFSYCIPKSSSKIMIQGDNFPAFFAGLLPEGRRLNALIHKMKTARDDLFSLFAAVGRDCIGDIYTLNSMQTEAPPTKKKTKLIFMTCLKPYLTQVQL